ncbi:MAG: hypothetical protein ABGW95_05085 [Candidatus Poseidoniia archaeon]
MAIIDWPQSGRILDYCAGGGGKALAIAARSDAAIHVHDVNPARMRDIAPRAERAKVTLHPFDNTLKYDVVLTDVPCSGSGTWRRSPELRWRLTPARQSTWPRWRAAGIRPMSWRELMPSRAALGRVSRPRLWPRPWIRILSLAPLMRL